MFKLILKLFSLLTSQQRKKLNDINCNFFKEPFNSKFSYCLNSIIFVNNKQEDEFLKFSNDNGGMTRTVWRLMFDLKIFSQFEITKLTNAKYFEKKLVTISSSVII
jgi:hypothetical protein